MILDTVINGLSGLISFFRNEVYEFHLRLMQSQRFDGMGANHPHPAIREQLIFNGNSTLVRSDVTFKEVDVDAYITLIKALDDIILENPLDDCVYSQVAQLRERVIQRKNISAREITDTLTGTAIIGTLPVNYDFKNSYIGLYLDQITHTICLIPE